MRESVCVCVGGGGGEDTTKLLYMFRLAPYSANCIMAVSYCIVLLMYHTHVFLCTFWHSKYCPWWHRSFFVRQRNVACHVSLSSRVSQSYNGSIDHRDAKILCWTLIPKLWFLLMHIKPAIYKCWYGISSQKFVCTICGVMIIYTGVSMPAVELTM